jgi:hypothetical protein
MRWFVLNVPRPKIENRVIEFLDTRQMTAAATRRTFATASRSGWALLETSGGNREAVYENLRPKAREQEQTVSL